jgi:hypothetical protein
MNTPEGETPAAPDGRHCRPDPAGSRPLEDFFVRSGRARALAGRLFAASSSLLSLGACADERARAGDEHPPIANRRRRRVDHDDPTVARAGDLPHEGG